MDTTAVTLEEALQTADDDEQLKAEVMELVCTFMAVVENIVAMSDEDLGNYQVASKDELYQSQLETFMMMLDEKINPFNQETMDQEQGQVDPRMQQQAQYSFPLAITTFDEMDQYISEYGLGSTLKAGMKLASKTTGIGNKTKVMGNAVGKGILGKKKFGALKTNVSTGIKTAKTNIANTATSGLQKTGSLANKLGAKKPGGFLNKVGTRIQKSSASLADKISNRRLGRYSSSSKLSKFTK